MTEAKVERYNNSPAIIINGKAYPPMMATIRTNNHDSVVLDKGYYKRLGESGVKIFFVICDTEWLKPGAYEQFLQEAELLFQEVPDAYIMLRIGLHPPIAWCEEHIDELVQYSDGKLKPAHLYTESYEATLPGMYSLCSEAWRRDAGKALLKTCDKIDRLPFADRIVGYFFAAGGTSEWYYITPMEYTKKTNYFDTGGFEQTTDIQYDNVYADVSPAFQKHFSTYLKKKYKTDEALQAAWQDRSVTIQNPGIPDCEARYFINGVDYDIDHPNARYATSGAPAAPSNGTNIGCFIDIDKHCKVFDFYRALHLGSAESVIYFGSLIKDRYPNKLTGAFYGAAGSTKVFSFGQIGGVNTILNSDCIDFLASPGVYENRQPGGFTGQRQVHDSFRLHGKMFVVEEDARTHAENDYDKNYLEIYDIKDSYHVLKREFGRNICQDLQAWWFDQHIGGGRYKDPAILDLFKKQQQIAHTAYSLDRTKPSEIAFLYDEESYHVVSEETTHQMVELFRNYEIDLIGAPADRYYHNDIGLMPDYKLYVFVNCMYLNDKEREAIHSKLQKNNATALFLYAAGLINPDRSPMLSADHITELIGITTTELGGRVMHGKFKITDSPLLKNLDKGEIYGDFKRKMWANCASYLNRIKTAHVSLYPLYYADDKNAETAARFLDSGKPAVSVKRQSGYTSIYCASKYLSADVIREIARFAGCHIFCESDDVLYVNSNYITFHAASSGEKTITLPAREDLYEVYEDVYYCKDSDTVTFSIQKGETKMFMRQRR